MVILKQGEQRKRVAFERATSKVTKDFEKKRQLRLGHRDPGTRDWLYLKFESKQQLRSVYRAPQKAIITEGEKRYLFDRSALRRERKTHRCHLCLGDIKTNNTTCIIKKLCLILLTVSSVVLT